MSELIPLTFSKIMQSKAYTLFILGTEEKHFAIYAEAAVGQKIQAYLGDHSSPRPYTHDLISSIFGGFNIKILQVLIYDIKEAIYFARLFLEQTIDNQRTILEIDARPSDCLTLALMHDVPIYATPYVLQNALELDASDLSNS